MSNLAIVALRIIVVLIGAGALFAQFRIVPAIGFGIAGDAELPSVGLPYTVAGIAVIACVEAILVAVWMLLSMVRRDAIFTERAFRWVDVIIGAAAVATSIALALGIHCYFVVEPILDAPGLILMSLIATVLGTAFVLLMLVMRGLLRTATSLQAELTEVV